IESAATIRAGAGRARNTRSATGARSGRQTARHVARDLLTVGLIGAAAAALLVEYAVFRIEEQGDRDEQRPAGAIVVLGAAQYDGRPSAVFAARLDHAVALYRKGLAPYLVMTGGKQPGDRTTEAAVARAYAIERGVPAAHILMEDQGRSTLESLRAVGEILHAHGIGDAVFVSDRTHMLRVLLIARDQGIIGWASPTTTSPSDSDLKRKAEATIHELGGLALYALTGSSRPGDVGPVLAESPAPWVRPNSPTRRGPGATTTSG
ncbi:MAG TPA: YdcF family protein, partial [Candidatus Saccharimonadales bacterium]|nr:YdcF family protein [Candidatus Saccharimonadales bacterium]